MTRKIRIRFAGLFCLTMLLSASPPTLAQKKGSISGRAFDAKSDEALVGVNISILGTTRGTATDTEGRFRIENLAPGTYRLKFSYIGYEPLVRTDVVVASARHVVLNVGLKRSVVALQGVVVRPSYFSDESETAASSTNLSREEIRRFPGGFEDVVRTAATLPGVAVVNEGGRNDLIVRGGGPSENLYLINGIEVPNINHFGNQGSSSGALSFINIDFIDAVEFSTGGFSVRYGDKMSSVLSLRMRPGRDDRLGGRMTISATQFGLDLEGPLTPKGTFLFSARRSYLDFIFRAAGLAFVPVYSDFNWFSNFDLSELDRVSIIALTALDHIDRDQSSFENRVKNADILDNSQKQIIAGVNYRRLIPRGFLSATLNVNHNRFRLSQEDEFQFEYYNSRADETELNLKLTSYLNFSRNSGLVSGVSFRNVFNKNTTVFADTVYDRSGRRVSRAELGVAAFSQSDNSARQLGAYLEWEQNLSRYVNLTAGLRGDYYGFLDDSFYPAARLRANFKPGERIRLKASAGRYFQPPSYVWVVNPFNRALKALRNDMLIFGVEYLLREDTNASLELYHKSYRDLPTGVVPGKTDYLVLTNTGVGFGGREDDFQSFGYIDLVSDGSGTAYGFELQVQKKFSDVPLYGQASLAFSKSEFTANNGRTYPGQFDQRLVLNLSAGYKFNPRWEVSGKFRYFTGAPYTPAYPPSQNNGFTQNLPDEYLSARLDPGHHLDLRVDRRFNFNRWNMIVFVDIQNIYNNKVQVRPRYDFWEQNVEDTNAIGILPSIGVRAEF